MRRRRLKQAAVAAAWGFAAALLGGMCDVALHRADALIASGATTMDMQNATGDDEPPPTPPPSLTKAQIQAEEQDAVNLMNEVTLKPRILPGGVKQFTLTASKFGWNFYRNVNLWAWGYNGQIPGPLIRVQVGDRVEIVVHNDLPEPTTVHWHGLAVPNAMDGVPGFPEPAIQPGGTFVYRFTVTSQMIGTHWYHSHYDDDYQVDAGLNGVIIVDPKTVPPSMRHVRDVLFVLGAGKQDGSDNENTFLINGKAYPDTPQLTVKRGTTVYLRIVNACAETFHAMTIDGYDVKIVAEDGQPQPDPQTVSVVSIAPSETVDVEFTADRTGTFPFHDTVASSLINPNDDADPVGGMMTLIHVIP